MVARDWKPCPQPGLAQSQAQPHGVGAAHGGHLNRQTIEIPFKNSPPVSKGFLFKAMSNSLNKQPFKSTGAKGYQEHTSSSASLC